MAIVARTPRTPGELFTHLTLNGPPSAVPTITLFPPTPPVELSLIPKLEQPGSARSSRSTPLAEVLRSPSHASSPGSIPADVSPTANKRSAQSMLKHRRLASNEARQLTLLLTQHLWPVRTNAKGLMKESISLAEKLHEAGIRWDKHRRVMGMHLKGIWEEGVRLGNARMPGGLSAMDLYVQGSFLSIAEEPHPLDPMPIPLEVHPSQFAALPKLTLSHSGVTAALPGMNDHAAMQEQSTVVVPQTPVTGPSMLSAAMSSAMPHEMQHKEKKRWRDKKKHGLKIKVDSHRKPRVGAVAIQQPMTAVSTRGFIFSRMRRWRRIRLGFKLGKVVIDTVPRSARRVSAGGWEPSRQERSVTLGSVACASRVG